MQNPTIRVYIAINVGGVTRIIRALFRDVVAANFAYSSMIEACNCFAVAMYGATLEPVCINTALGIEQRKSGASRAYAKTQGAMEFWNKLSDDQKKLLTGGLPDESLFNLDYAKTHN